MHSLPQPLAAALINGCGVQKEHQSHRSTANMWAYRHDKGRWMTEATVERVRGFKAFSGVHFLAGMPSSGGHSLPLQHPLWGASQRLVILSFA